MASSQSELLREDHSLLEMLAGGLPTHRRRGREFPPEVIKLETEIRQGEQDLLRSRVIAAPQQAASMRAGFQGPLVVDDAIGNCGRAAGRFMTCPSSMSAPVPMGIPHVYGPISLQCRVQAEPGVFHVRPHFSGCSGL